MKSITFATCLLALALSSRSALAIKSYEDAIQIGGFCVAAANYAAGTELELLPCTRNADQAWDFTPDNLIVNAHTGLCVGTAGGSLANYTTLQQEACTGSASERWFYDPGSHTIQNVGQATENGVHAATTTVTLPAVFSLANYGAIQSGNYLVAFQYHYTADQSYTVSAQTSNVGMIGNAGYYVTTLPCANVSVDNWPVPTGCGMNDGDSLVIQAVPSTAGGNPQQPANAMMPALQPPNVVWILTRGGLLVNSNWGKCVSTGNYGSLANGTPMIAFTCHQTIDQYWGAANATFYDSDFGSYTGFNGSQIWPSLSLADYGSYSPLNWLMTWQYHNGADQKGWFLY